MKLLLVTIFIITVSTAFTFDFFLFVEAWPGTWIHDAHVNYNFNDTYWSIHGIWPEYKNGSYPQFCNKSSTQFNITKLDPIKNNLTMYWTDFKNSTGFLEHEFMKHFTCALDTFPDPYQLFWYGLALRQKFNVYSALNASNLLPNNTGPIHLSYFSNAIKKYFGTNVVIGCEKDTTGKYYLLSEIRFCLTKNFKLFDCPTLLQNKEACQGSSIVYYKL